MQNLIITIIEAITLKGSHAKVCIGMLFRVFQSIQECQSRPNYDKNIKGKTLQSVKTWNVAFGKKEIQIHYQKYSGSIVYCATFIPKVT